MAQLEDKLKDKINTLYNRLDDMSDALDKGYRLRDASEPSRIRSEIRMLEELQKVE